MSVQTRLLFAWNTVHSARTRLMRPVLIPILLSSQCERIRLLSNPELAGVDPLLICSNACLSQSNPLRFHLFPKMLALIPVIHAEKPKYYMSCRRYVFVIRQSTPVSTGLFCSGRRSCDRNTRSRCLSGNSRPPQAQRNNKTNR